ncbi:hypothetical protein [Nocardioides sp. SR21]|uniref:hypothetical protein n=1 Tax=Nocardioides sp. SR21 TaxID=2919501 RepID=UPI001FAA88D9|nr:hypothetical protein [Nocardioides sp. SR21]
MMATATLTRLEGERMLRHPALWLGLPVMLWWVSSTFDQDWSGALYTGLIPAFTPLLLGISLASMSAFSREHVPVADDAPMASSQRSAARLLAGLGPVALTALVVVAGTIWLRVRGGLDLGDEPGRTLHAHYTLPELIQPVLLACVAVAAGAAVVHVVRSRLAAAILLVVGWFLVGTYWLFDSPVVRYLAPVQPQPWQVEVGPWDADPTAFPSTWLLSAPGEYQDHWARIVVSPAVAAWHDVYLVGLVAVLVGIAVPGRFRVPLLVGGVIVAAAAAGMQSVVAP